MDDEQFWKIIKRARGAAWGDPDGVAESVEAHLARLPAAEIESYDAILRSKLVSAYNWKLWGAAYLLNGGCSDDSFEYFRGWLIAQGQKVYDAAIADPDSLVKFADPDDDYHECQDMLGVACRAYETVTGNELVYSPARTDPAEPTGEEWDFDDMEETAKRLPRLARKYDN